MSIELPSKPTNVKDTPANPLAARVFLGGAPKTGKTTMASQWAPEQTIYLDLQHGTDLLPGDHYVIHCNNWKDFSDAVTRIAAGGHKFLNVVIDPIDKAYEYADSHAASLHGKIAAAQVDWGKATNHADALFRDAINGLLARRGMGVWFIGHTEVQAVDGRDQVVPKLNKRVREDVTGEVEHIFLAERVKDKTYLHTRASGKFEAGSRLSLPSPLPMNAQEIYKAMNAGLKALKEETK